MSVRVVTLVLPDVLRGATLCHGAWDESGDVRVTRY